MADLTSKDLKSGDDKKNAGTQKAESAGKDSMKGESRVRADTAERAGNNGNATVTHSKDNAPADKGVVTENRAADSTANAPQSLSPAAITNNERMENDPEQVARDAQAKEITNAPNEAAKAKNAKLAEEAPSVTKAARGNNANAAHTPVETPHETANPVSASDVGGPNDPRYNPVAAEALKTNSNAPYRTNRIPSEKNAPAVRKTTDLT